MMLDLKNTNSLYLNQLYSLYAKKSNKRFQSFQQTSKNIDRQNSPDLQIKSPFYNKNCKNHKQNCFCPYHKYKRSNLTTFNKGITRKSQNTQNTHLKLNSLQQNRISNNKLQKLKIKYDSNYLQKDYKNLTVKTQNYDHIEHKVNCRNQQFQEFLLKNQLCILKQSTNRKTLKDEKSKRFINTAQSLKSQLAQQQQYLQYFLSNYEGDHSKSSQFSRNRNKKNSQPTQSKIKHHKLHKKQKNETLSMQDLVKFKNMISAIKMKKYSNTVNIQRLLVILNSFAKKQLQKYGQTVVYKEIIKIVADIQKLGTMNSHKKIKKNTQKSIISSKVNSNKRVLTDSQKSIINISRHDITKKSQKKKRPSIFCTKTNNMISNQQTEEKDELKNEYVNTQSQNKIRNQSIISKPKNNDKKIPQKLRYKYLQQFHTSKLSILHKKSKLNGQFFDDTDNGTHNHSKSKTLDEGSIIQTMQLAGVKYQRFHDVEKQKEKKRQMRQKQKQQIQMHLQKKALKQQQEKAQLRKKYIDKNKNFLIRLRKKMQSQLDLGEFVINDGDSLLTQKKKIRYLKQILFKANKFGNFQSSQSYQELAKYIELYTSHFNLVIGKQQNSNIQDQGKNQGQCLKLQSLIQSRDRQNSLKFIELQHSKKQKQEKVDGWISIPQYTTIYQNKKNINRVHMEISSKNLNIGGQSVIKNYMQAQEQQQVSSTSQRSLIQKDLKNNLQISSSYQQTKMSQCQIIEKQYKKLTPFEKKIEYYRNKILNKTKTQP